MSLLEQLQKKRSTLQPTATIVTTATGERYLEPKTFSNDAAELTPIKLAARSYGFVVDTKPDTIASCILDKFLYLGSQDAVFAENINLHQITHILSVGIDTPYFNANDAATLQRTMFLPCLDLPETELFVDVLPNAVEFIENAKRLNGRILVHCNAGVSRAASIVIAYLMLQQNMCFDDAFTLVKAKRACIQPNAGFLKQLKSYRK